MLDYYKIITLTTLGYIDFKTYKIPNAILSGWLLIIIMNYLMRTVSFHTSWVISAFVTAGMYYPIRHVAKCSAGDFKLYAILMLTDEPQNILMICFISMIISLIPLACGVKKVPIALTTLFGYIAFLLIRGV